MGNSLRIRSTGNIEKRVRQRPRCRYISKRKIRVMTKLDESKVRYILRKSRNGVDTSKIAKEMNVSARWIRKLCARYGNIELKDVRYPMRMGRPSNSMPGRREHSAILTYRQAVHLGAPGLEKVIENATGIHIAHNTIHDVLKEVKMANTESKKSRKRKWVRYERTYSNSTWHTDYKMLSDGRWLLCYEDDASRFVTRYGVLYWRQQSHTTASLLPL